MALVFKNLFEAGEWKSKGSLILHKEDWTLILQDLFAEVQCLTSLNLGSISIEGLVGEEGMRTHAEPAGNFSCTPRFSVRGTSFPYFHNNRENSSNRGKISLI
ncbi:hypothetical protein FZC79_05310 [Rossellomorea vietnamensis]|uniref:Uncharacterized protein n=1 Tax=Rossellomorea vietnamensis TaxID=218284 RepID=A0A5D4KHH9_9BACI|nr:hypothetical protein [Rossellomorea vietnamensis]TYR76310.1 hypothetical protein FZC79_05310 [Rossellomorea vietnamensis]